MSRVKIGNGTIKVSVGRQATSGSTFTYTYLQHLDTVDLPNPVRDDIDVTNQDSPGSYEYIAGMSEGGEVTFDGILWVPGNETETILKEIKASGEIVRLRFEIDGDEVETYETYLKSLERSAPNKEKRTMSAIFKVSAMVAEGA